ATKNLPATIQRKGLPKEPVSIQFSQTRSSGFGLVSDSQCLDAAVEARNLAGREIGMNNALAGSAVDLGLGRLEGSESGSMITGGDGFFNLADEGAHTAAARLVHRGAGFDLAGSILGLGLVGHIEY